MIVRLQRALPFLIVMGAAVFLWTVADAFEYRPRAGRPGPDVWPKIVLALMFLAAAWGALQSVLTPVDDEDMSGLVRIATRAVGREEDAEKDLRDDGAPAAQGTVFAVGGMLALVAYVGLISWIGFTVATFAVMFAVMMLSGVRRPLVALLWSAIGTLGFFIVFQKVAYISLPLGEGPFRALSLGLMALLGVR